MTPHCQVQVERETGFEPATPTLARLCSTTELFPQKRLIIKPRRIVANALHSVNLSAPRFSRNSLPQVPRRLLRRRRVDEETRSPLEAGHSREHRNDLEVPV